MRARESTDRDGYGTPERTGLVSCVVNAEVVQHQQVCAQRQLLGDVPRHIVVHLNRILNEYQTTTQQHQHVSTIGGRERRHTHAHERERSVCLSTETKKLFVPSERTKLSGNIFNHVSSPNTATDRFCLTKFPTIFSCCRADESKFSSTSMKFGIPPVTKAYSS